MKTFYLSIFFIGILTGNAQDKNQFYALDAKMNQTVLDSSKYILWIHEQDSERWQWDYYYTWGTLVKSTNYSDHDGTIKNGRFCIYNTFGNLDSTGVYEHGKKNGLFLKLLSVTKDSIEIVRQYDYVNDSLIRFTNLLAKKERDSNAASEMEPEFTGGRLEWLSYLSSNLHYPERALLREIQGMVRICFQVDNEGVVKEPFIFKSVEYSLDQEAIRIIKNSGKWIPGNKDGISVSSNKIQLVKFILVNH
jgi:periplasmic protein TonB